MSRTRSVLCWLLVCLVMTACGGDATPDEESASSQTTAPDGTTTTDVNTEQPDTTVAESEVTSTTSGQGGSAPDPCSVLTVAELEAAAGYTLDPGVFIDLANQGIDGATCVFVSENDSDGNVSVTVITGETGSAFFDVARTGESTDISGIGDRAIANIDDIQASILFQQGDVYLGIDVVYLTGTSEDPGVLQQRLEDLATTASGRI